MVRQERAAHTRGSLIRAAAVVFQRHGYAGATLAEVARRAGVTMGALTFHFPSKRRLAQDVGVSGAESVARAIRDARLPVGLNGVVSLTYLLGDLLRGDVTVCAAARLAEEGEEFKERWLRSWEPVLADLLERAQTSGSMPAALPAESVALLVRHVLTGMACAARTDTGEARRPDLPEQFQAIWHLVFSDALGSREPSPPDREGPPPRTSASCL